MKTIPESVLKAISFAARAHRQQIRKDKETPYVAHVFRVCLLVRDVFGIDDPATLAVAVLHDTIEDTPTDYDDIADNFGAQVADWVAVLTKDMREPDTTREPAYFAALAAADWQVQIIKLADLLDNLLDSPHLPAASRQRSTRRAREFMDFFRAHVRPEAKTGFALVEGKLVEAENAL